MNNIWSAASFVMRAFPNRPRDSAAGNSANKFPGGRIESVMALHSRQLGKRRITQARLGGQRRGFFSPTSKGRACARAIRLRTLGTSSARSARSRRLTIAPAERIYTVEAVTLGSANHEDG